MSNAFWPWVTLFRPFLRAVRCQHSQTNPVREIYVVLHDLQSAVHRCVVSCDPALELVDGFPNPTQVANDRVIQGDLAQLKLQDKKTSRLEESNNQGRGILHLADKGRPFGIFDLLHVDGCRPTSATSGEADWQPQN